MGSQLQQVKVEDSQKIQQALQAMEEAENLHNDLLSFGLDGIDLYVDNIEGDWLENWGNHCEDL